VGTIDDLPETGTSLSAEAMSAEFSFGGGGASSPCKGDQLAACFEFLMESGFASPARCLPCSRGESEASSEAREPPFGR